MRHTLLLLAALLGLVAAPLTAGDGDEGPSRIVAVGDLHGDYDAWEEIARAAGLVDEGGHWKGGTTTLVQLGDITDRGPDSLRIIRQLQALQEEAAEAGGAVVVLLGNHEAMNVLGDLRYVHPGEYEAFEDRRSEGRREATWKANREKLLAYYRQDDPELSVREAKAKWIAETPLGLLAHRRAWSPGGELGSWASALPAVVRIGATLFAHGGLSEERTREPIDALNARYRYALGADPLTDRAILEDPLGPIWYRGNVMRQPAPVEAADEEAGGDDTPRLGRVEELALVLSRYGARQLVVAHTPSMTGIVAELGGRLIRIDTGISSYYGGPASYLEIGDDTLRAYRRTPDGEWVEQDLEVTAS
ncbi:metallophosphoesterase [Erythrobacter sp. SD-21]|uniref:metallophosphoesterase n=1 Tax=Erythrobacter sp. SD-21 TaxID=161528 RepID=UPI000153FB52|nr:metallophosphoesterase [Erythrobacter sp. SD-21]EDL49156.1 metallophosphoesterase [Erythrobacter sp. SD-21]